MKKKLREVKPEHRNQWALAYQDLFCRTPANTLYLEYGALQRDGGITDALIVAVLEAGVKRKAKNTARWALTVLTDLAAQEVKTTEDWERFKADEQVESEQQKAEQRSGNITQPKMSRAAASLAEWMNREGG